MRVTKQTQGSSEGRGEGGRGLGDGVPDCEGVLSGCALAFSDQVASFSTDRQQEVGVFSRDCAVELSTVVRRSVGDL